MKTYREMTELFEQANDSFLFHEYDLFDSRVSERTLCGALMIYIRDQIRNRPNYIGYFVDVEYNRNKGKMKTIIDGDFHVLRVNCDVILHSRGNHPEQDNLIAIEMKKSNRPIYEKTKDRNRLIALTKNSFDDIWTFDGETLPEHVCRYVLGVYYEIDYRTSELILEYYSKGKKVCSYRRNFF